MGRTVTTVRAVVAAGVVLLLAHGAAAAALAAWGARETPDARADLVVVLGCSVEQGGRPSDCLASRVEAGVALWREGRAPRLLLTGGEGQHPPAEGVVAAAYARSLGVPLGALVVEARSTSTQENAALGLAVAPASSVILATDGFHLWRAERCFAAQGVSVSGRASEGQLVRTVPGALREVLVIAYDLWTGRCLPVAR